MNASKMTIDINEKPPIWKWIILALQHVFAMFGATILVPILVNGAAGSEVLTIPVALVTSGIGTLIYILCTKGKSPVYLGSSFAFITPLATGAVLAGIGGAMTGAMLVGLIYVIVALIIAIVGKEWLQKILPPIVIGPMIMIIGLGLASSAVSSIGIAAGTEAISIKGVIVALFTFLVTGLVMLKAKGFFKVVPFLIGIASGYILSCILGLVDFSPVLAAAFFSVPDFVIPFVSYTPTFAAALTIAPIALVTIAEHIGDHTALSTIIGKDLIKEPGLNRTLLGDGLATLTAALLGGPPNTTYGENTSVVGMTKVASVWVIGLAAIFAICLGFLGKFTALISTIPSPVLGGVSLLLYGFIAVNGLKVLIENRVDFSKSRNVIIASSMLVLGLGGAALTFGSVTVSGMSLAAVVGVLLNLLLPHEDEEKEETKTEEAKIEKEEEKDENKEEVENTLNILDHPLVEHKLSILRDKKTGTKEFRELVSELGMFLCYEAMRDASLDDVEIETPMTKLIAKRLDEDKYAFLPILRAGTGMLDGLINVIPNAKIGHIGMYRNEETLEPVRYFFKVPKDIKNREVLVLDPMLATGGSGCDAIEQLKKEGVTKIKFLCLIAAPEGVKRMQEEHPDVKIYTAALDEKLNENGYIVPGLGDAGDRIFGTK
ncbi:MAG: uracil phosphoribosyltransferase [Clostridia bacterium]|nr:uracil phosphoribosyltransferase [Clostridia bacterium]